MKKILLTALIATGLATSAEARTLTPNEALGRLHTDRTAMALLNGATPSTSRLVKTVRTADGDAALYLFRNAGSEGYMLVSADDVAVPLLGYSHTPLPENPSEMPPQLSWWLSEYAAEIEAAQQSATYSGGLTPITYPRAERAAIAPMLKTAWNQDAPYNDLTPRIDGKATYTGCVATAVAQIMKYFNYPAKGVGEATCRDSNNKEYTASMAVSFDWGNMLPTYSQGNYNSTQGKAVATLMKCCGYALRMGYGTEGSGTQSLYVPSALTEHFGYDPQTWLYSRSHYTLADWEEMIYTNLATCGPVYYSGAAPNGGHAFVCDGYSSNGFYHFDWGWGGWCNGYFRLTALNPDGVGIGGFAGGYNYGQDVVLGIRPAVSGTKKPAARLTCSSDVTAKVTGYSLDCNIELNGGWFNMSPYINSFYFTMAFTDVVSGKTVYSNINSSPWEVDLFYGWTSFTAKIPASLPVGRYTVELMSRLGTREQWVRALYPVNLPGYVTLIKEGTGKYTVESHERGRLTIDGAELLTPLYHGCPAKLRIKATNNTSIEVPQHVALGLAFVDSKGDVNIVAQGDSYLFNLAPGESETAVTTFSLHEQGGYELNKTYEMIIYDPETSHIFGTIGKKYFTSAPSPRLFCKSLTFDGNPYDADRRALKFNINVGCREGFYAGRPVIALFDSKGGGSVAMSSFDEQLILDTNQSQQTTCTFAFMDAQTGNTYTAVPFYIKDGGWAQMDGNYVSFTMGKLSGIDSADSAPQGLQILYNRSLRQAIVSGEAPIVSVTAISASGTPLAVETSMEGNRATLSLAMAPNGVAFITATDAEGHTATAKIVIH